MRRLTIAAFLAVSGAVAEDGPFLKGAALQAEIERNCAQGCIVFSPVEALELQAQIDAFVKSKTEERYRAGQLSCRNAVNFYQ